MLSDDLIISVLTPPTSEPYILARVVARSAGPGPQLGARPPSAGGIQPRCRRQTGPRLSDPLLDRKMIDFGERGLAPARHDMVAHD